MHSGDLASAEQSLRRALKTDPDSMADEQVDATTSPCRGPCRRPPRTFRAPHTSGDLLDQRQSHNLRSRLLPLRTPHAIHPPLPLMSLETVGTAASAVREATFR